MKVLSLLSLVAAANAFDYGLVDGSGGLSLTDTATGIGGIQTLFTGEDVSVEVSGIEWEKVEGVEGSSDTLFYETFLDGELQASGNVSLADVERDLPSSFDAGLINVPKGEGGSHSVEVKLSVDQSESTVGGSYEAFGAGVAIIPLLVVLVLAMTTHMVSRPSHTLYRYLHATPT